MFAALVVLAKEKPYPKLVHVHIPKTGGTALQVHESTTSSCMDNILIASHAACCAQERLHKRDSLPKCAKRIEHIEGRASHKLTVAKANVNGRRHALVTIRDPYARFHSAFEYWRHGSDRYPRSKGSASLDFTSFANALNNMSHTSHRYSRKIVSGKVASSATWYIHFLRQTFWIGANSSSASIIYVCYREGGHDVLAEATRTLARHNLACDLRRGGATSGQPSLVNPTTNKSALPPFASLSEGARAYISSAYGSDDKLWKRVCGNGTSLMDPRRAAGTS